VGSSSTPTIFELIRNAGLFWRNIGLFYTHFEQSPKSHPLRSKQQQYFNGISVNQKKKSPRRRWIFWWNLWLLYMHFKLPPKSHFGECDFGGLLQIHSLSQQHHIFTGVAVRVPQSKHTNREGR